MPTSDDDLGYLRRCVTLARTARDGDNEPFGSLPVDESAPVSAVAHVWARR